VKPYKTFSHDADYSIAAKLVFEYIAHNSLDCTRAAIAAETRDEVNDQGPEQPEIELNMEEACIFELAAGWATNGPKIIAENKARLRKRITERLNGLGGAKHHHHHRSDSSEKRSKREHSKKEKKEKHQKKGDGHHSKKKKNTTNDDFDEFDDVGPAPIKSSGRHDKVVYQDDIPDVNLDSDNALPVSKKSHKQSSGKGSKVTRAQKVSTDSDLDLDGSFT
jgi:hypothetical protein